MRLVVVFDVPEHVAETRDAWTTVYDLLHLTWPLSVGNRFQIVSTDSSQPDPLLTFLGAYYEKDVPQ